MIVTVAVGAGQFQAVVTGPTGVVVADAGDGVYGLMLVVS